LKELRALIPDENGAQRVAFTDTWAKAREWMRSKLEDLSIEVDREAAGNVWATLRGASAEALSANSRSVEVFAPAGLDL
jgi:hypothetical protein